MTNEEKLKQALKDAKISAKNQKKLDDIMISNLKKELEEKDKCQRI
jgi:hypothetical protein